MDINKILDFINEVADDYQAKIKNANKLQTKGKTKEKINNIYEKVKKFLYKKL